VIPPKVSVIMPVRNEARFIEAALAGVLATVAPTLEVLVVDGRSTDGTAELVRAIAARDPRVRLLDNPAQIVPTALNLAIREARGEIIVRLDAHAEVDSEYVPQLVAQLEASGAANVGGVWETRPGAATAEAEAIAIVLSSPLGVGGATYRTGATAPTWVDTVPFGCWRKSTLLELGGFDEAMVRNQDDELNGRILVRGGKILLVPSVKIQYYARATLWALGRKFYQYGWFKPLALRKVGRAVTLRQFAPALALLGMTAGAAWWLIEPRSGWLGLLPLIAYGSFLCIATVWLARGRGVRVWVWIAPTLVTAHLANGAGFLRGVVEFLILRRDRWHRTRDLPTSR
jgi:glycosyltransferase involved in cell wall biosynthesis